MLCMQEEIPLWDKDIKADMGETWKVTRGQTTGGLNTSLGHLGLLEGGSHCWVLSKRMT